MLKILDFRFIATRVSCCFIVVYIVLQLFSLVKNLLVEVVLGLSTDSMMN